MEKRKNKHPNILVCTVNAWNSKVGDNTFQNLLKDYPKEHLASFFIREETPDSDICSRYFRISEQKIIKSILKRNTKTGESLNIEKDSIDDSKLLKQKNLYRNKNNFYYLKLFFREIIWKIGKWNTYEFNEFIDGFKPDIVIYEMSRYIHLNNIIMYILKCTGAKGIGCFWDDTFTYKQEKSISYKILRFFQRKNLKKLAKETQVFFSITPKTKKEADSFFDIDSIVLTKPLSNMEDYKSPNCKKPYKMLYTGNLGIGRTETLQLVVDALQKKKIFLDIYTNTFISGSMEEKLNTPNSEIHEAVSQDMALELQKEADILLFIESLKEDNKVARLSFSTKITDYYAAGKCIFAVGNKDLAPVELLKETDSALVAVSKDEIDKCIDLLEDPNIIEQYALKAFNTGRKNHSYKSIHDKFYNAILS